MSISITYDSGLNIYLKKISGKVNLSQVMASLNDKDQFDLTKNIFVLDDIIQAKFNFSLNQLYSFINETQQHLPDGILIFHAVISTSKSIITFAKAISSISSHRYKVSVFPTQQEGLDWLNEEQKVFGETSF